MVVDQKLKNLIEKDESEIGKNLGQDVKDAFPLADLFVDCRSKEKLKIDTKRFIELLFSYPIPYTYQRRIWYVSC